MPPDFGVLRSAALLSAILLCIAGCRPAAYDAGTANTQQTGRTAPWFDDVTDLVQLAFTHDPGNDAELYSLPRLLGSGVALLDFDNDGRLDLFLVQNGGANSASPNQLWRQTPAGTFVDVSGDSGLAMTGQGMGAAAGDFNNDGWTDLVVTEYGRTRLFENREGKLAELADSGVANPHWGMSAGFLDYDRDGWLDLVVVNYLIYSPAHRCSDAAGRQEFCGPNPFAGTVTRLFHNVSGASPEHATRFTDVTAESGLGAINGPGMGLVCADLNGDHWPDILVANDDKPNHLWINRHDGTFAEEAVLRGLAYNAMGESQGNMGIALGDVDGNGQPDVFVTHLTEELHVLWKQGPAGEFRDATGSAGLASPKWRSTGFGTLLADFDNDGRLDLALANGHVKRPPQVPPATGAEFWHPYRQHNQIFAGGADGKFQDVSANNGSFCGVPGVWRGLACGDLDNDGGVDLVVTGVADRAHVFKNVAPARGHWLSLRLIDPALGGRDAYGAEVTVHAGGRHQMRVANPCYSYLSSNDPRVHFGLGNATAVDRVDVIWPDGSTESFVGSGVDKLVTLARGKGDAQPALAQPRDAQMNSSAGEQAP